MFLIFLIYRTRVFLCFSLYEYLFLIHVLGLFIFVFIQDYSFATIYRFDRKKRIKKAKIVVEV